MNKKFVFVALSLFSHSLAFAESETVFVGKPTAYVSVNQKGGVLKQLGPEDAIKHKVLISRINGKYYWATRENTELEKIDAGVWTIYFAVGGAGYVKILNRDRRTKDFDEIKYDYVEHVPFMMGSLNYYGEYSTW